MGAPAAFPWLPIDAPWVANCVWRHSSFARIFFFLLHRSIPSARAAYRSRRPCSCHPLDRVNHDSSIHQAVGFNSAREKISLSENRFDIIRFFSGEFGTFGRRIRGVGFVSQSHRLNPPVILSLGHRQFPSCRFASTLRHSSQSSFPSSMSSDSRHQMSKDS
jgi:hypothetical protein